jgi:hypothetical protein
MKLKIISRKRAGCPFTAAADATPYSRFVAIILSVLLSISQSGCERADLWNAINSQTDALSEVTMTSMNVGSGSVVLNWTDPPDAGIQSIQITCTAIGLTGTVPTGVQTYSISGLTNGTGYTVLIKSVDSSGNTSTGITLDITPMVSAPAVHFIYSTAELNAVRGGVAGYSSWTLGDMYYLMADLDLSAYGSWIPLGTAGTPFTGIFYGNGHTVNNLTINAGGSDQQGLFCQISSGGAVRNLVLVNANVLGKDYS